jgi:hypothetical protein
MNRFKKYWIQYKSNKKEKTKQEVISEIKDGFQVRERHNRLWIVENNVAIVELENTLTTEDVLKKLTEARTAAIDYYNGKVN